MQRRKVILALAMPLMMAASFLMATQPARAEEQTSAERARAADQAGYIIVDPQDAVAVDGRTFYPTGPISDETIVVIPDPDGSLPNGLTEATLKEFVAQRATVTSAASSDVGLMATQYSYIATSAGWSGAYTGGSIIGWDAYATVWYNFTAARGTSQRNAGSGLGFYQGYNGSEFGTWSAWYHLGTATASTTGGGSVPWGNVAATAKFRGWCATTNACGGYFWT